MKHEFINVICNLALFLSIITVAESCEKDKIAIGNTHQGGIIFYIDDTGEHGLVAAPSDQGKEQWGCWDNVTGADGSAVGTGYQNTLNIVNVCPDTGAAFICANLELNGYADWFLPSIEELNLIYINLKKNNLGHLKSTEPIFTWKDAYYWSSTSVDSSIVAWSINFKYGGLTDGFSKNNSNWVRAVRSF